MKNYKQSFFHSKYKTQNNDANNKENLWFRNVFLNNPRSNKIRNFGKNYENLASSIKSNNKFESYSQRKKNENGNNNDIINRLIKQSVHNTINVDRGLNYNYRPKNRSELFKRVNSFNNKPNEKNYITIKSSFSNSSIRNRKSGFTPSKEVVLDKDEGIGVKPKFKNIILRNLEDNLYSKITEEDRNNNYYNNSNDKDDNNRMFSSNKNNFKNGKDNYDKENCKEKNDKNKEKVNKGKKIERSKKRRIKILKMLLIKNRKEIIQIKIKKRKN
jgi:hypothetical protein